MKIILLLIMSLYCNLVVAQKVMDYAFLECQYDYAYIKDSLKGKVADDRLVLIVGNKVSKCYSYYSMQIDSINESPKKDELIQKAITHALKTNTDYPHKRMKTYVYKNYPQGKMTVTDGLLMQDYVYEDSLNKMNWMIKDSTQTILGYTAQMATCSFRGHQWTAWFVSEIPVMDGPWKFGGLPGLIVEVADKKHYHCFKLVGIRKVTDMPIVMSKTCIGTCRYEKIERIKFLKLQRKYLEDISGMIRLETDIDLDPNASVRQLTYQPLETE